jgi:hypothetical protein
MSWAGNNPSERWAAFRASIQHEIVKVSAPEVVEDEAQARFGQRHRIGWKRVKADFVVRVRNRSNYDSKLLKEGKK